MYSPARICLLIAGTSLALSVSALSASACEELPANGIPEGSIASVLPSRLADPGGVRSALGARGIVVGANYIGEVFGNTSGGVERSAHYDGRLELFVDADLSKIAGLKGLCFHANGYQIHGTSIPAENLGSLMPVSYIEATPATRLFELYLEQDLFNKAVSIRFGQLAADSQFLLSEGGGAFINGTWGWPSITAADLPSGGPAYPLATPGVTVTITPNDKFSILAGIYNGDPVGPCAGDPQECNDHGLEFRIKDPPLVMYEGAYKYSAGQLPGTFKAGGWVHFGDFAHQRLDINGNPAGATLLDPQILDGNHGFYAIVDQMIYRVPGDEAKGIAVFGRVIGAPADRNLVNFYAEAGVTFSGMVPGRADDVLGIGFAYTGISNDASGFDQDSGLTVVRNYEALIEISYTAKLAEGWSLQPDFQYIWNPGGRVPEAAGVEPVGNAAVLGLRTSLYY